MRGYNIAVVGALGAVGEQMRNILEKSELPINGFKPLDIKTNENKIIQFKGKPTLVKVAGRDAFKDVDIAIFSAGENASKELAPIAVEEGAVVIDNSNAWRMDPEVPLIVPEVNPNDIEWHKGIIANPNCSTIQMLVAIKPIHDVYNIKRIVVSTYQAVSGSGLASIEDLKAQVTDLVNGKKIKSKFYTHQIAFNAIPQIDIFLDNKYTKEEMKMNNETKKILDKNINVNATCVRISVFRCHSEAVSIELEKSFQLEKINKLLREAPGVEVLDNPDSEEYPLAVSCEGKYKTFVGRIRRDFTIKNGLNMWVVSDNLLKGAALNAVQIAELLVKKDLVYIPTKKKMK